MLTPISRTTDFDLRQKGVIVSGFPATVENPAPGIFRHWLTLVGQSEHFHGIGRATFGAGKRTRLEIFKTSDQVIRRSGEPCIGNLPTGWQPVQPVRIALQGGGYRLWFWAHSPADGIVRYLAAESDDDRVYNVVDPHRPCLWHYCDRAAALKLAGVDGLAWNAGNLSKRPHGEPRGKSALVANDATTVYQLPDGTFEIFTTAIKSVPKDSPSFIPWDNAAGFRRYIRRYTSRDGRNFEYGGTAVAWDRNDPPYIQNYHLSVHYCADGSRLGLLGRYDVVAQTMDIELCTSPDGVTWQRSRKPLIQRAPDEMSVYTPCNPIFEENGKKRLFYSAFNYIHNGKYVIGGTKTGVLRSVLLDDIH
ncbi:MAG: hypothetical protein J6S21_05120 [Victivallales bacterium]|nr:hypothetical protein [Victivallales bacterium]